MGGMLLFLETKPAVMFGRWSIGNVNVGESVLNGGPPYICTDTMNIKCDVCCRLPSLVTSIWGKF